MKRTTGDLAIFGGIPFFSRALHVGRPNLPSKQVFMLAAEEIWDAAYLTNNGPKVRQFEAELASTLSVKHCVVICNATCALEIAIRALDMQGEVIVPSFTFVATAHSLQWQGITPIFCDIDPNTHCMDPAKIERLITPRTTGIIPVHLWGTPCDTDAIQRVAQKHNLSVLYDAAHALACDKNGTMVGNFGDAEVFSFHATKVMTTFEGGCITTNNDGLAEKIRFMKNFGFAGKDNVTHLGINGKMSEISAAMGLASLKELNHFIECNRTNYQAYKRRISGIFGLSVYEHSEKDARNFHYVIVDVADSAGISRDAIVAVLEKENILARRYFYPGCHRMEPYRSYYPNAGMLLPVTERLSERLFCLPNGTATSTADVARICELLAFIMENRKEIIMQPEFLIA